MPAFLNKYRRSLSVVALLLSLLGLYAAVGLVLLPHLVANAASAYVRDILHRQLTIGALRFDPFRAEVRIAGLRLREADGSPLLGFAALRVNADPWLSLWRRTITLDALELRQPDIALLVDKDGSLNLARLLPPSDTPEPETKTPPPRVHIVTLVIDDGRLGFEDRSRAQVFRTELKPIRFSLSDFRTEAGASSAYRFSAESAQQERLEWDGDLSVQPLGSSGSFRVSNLLLTTLDAYLQDQLPVKLASGAVSLEGRYQLRLQPGLDAEIELPSLRLRELAVQPRRNAAAIAPIAVGEIALQTVTLSLVRREVQIGKLDIERPAIDLRRASDGGLNLQKLVTPAPVSPPPPAEAPPAAPAPADTSAADAKPWRIAVDRIKVANGKLDFEDRSVTPTARFRVAPIVLDVDGYHSGDDAVLTLQAALGLGDRGKLSAHGSLRLVPLSTELDLDLSGFALPTVQPYLHAATTLQLEHGVLGAKARLRYGKDATPALSFSGDIGISGFAARERPKGEELLKWRQLDLRRLVYEQTPDRLTIDSVVLRQPFARVVIAADRKLNLTQLSTKPANPADAAAAAEPSAPAGKADAKPALPLRIGSVRIDEGSMYFADRSIDPAFAATIVGLKGAITSITTTPGTRSTIQLDGRVDRFAPVTIAGSAALLDPTNDTDLRLAFRNMELSTFNPYSGKFAGYNIAKGKLTTELAYKIDQRVIAAEHRIVIDQLEFGAATGSKDAAPLPIKLAAALLKDRHGVIDLNLPVRGSLDDPEFKYGTIVWKVLSNTLSKIVTAPFAALGRLFGGREDLAFVDFTAGSAALAGSERTKLDTLARALIERPQLKLDVPVTSSATDAEALASAALAARLPPGAVDEKSRLRALEKLFREVYGKEVRYPNGIATPAAQLAFIEPAVRGGLTPDSATLDALARERAQAVQALLLQNAEIAPERIFVTSGRAANSGENQAVRMEFKLQ